MATTILFLSLVIGQPLRGVRPLRGRHRVLVSRLRRRQAAARPSLVNGYGFY
jgi:hypothetical protein